MVFCNRGFAACKGWRSAMARFFDDARVHRGSCSEASPSSGAMESHISSCKILSFRSGIIRGELVVRSASWRVEAEAHHGLDLAYFSCTTSSHKARHKAWPMRGPTANMGSISGVPDPKTTWDLQLSGAVYFSSVLFGQVFSLMVLHRWLEHCGGTRYIEAFPALGVILPQALST